jgi:hypothetical protein
MQMKLMKTFLAMTSREPRTQSSKRRNPLHYAYDNALCTVFEVNNINVILAYHTRKCHKLHSHLVNYYFHYHMLP